MLPNGNIPRAIAIAAKREKQRMRCLPCQFWTMLALLIMLMLAATGCDGTRVYEQNEDIENYIWEKQARKSFAFEITDTTKHYNILANMRHTTFYPFSNIWVMAYTTYPDGTLQEQRLELFLADKDGKWYGDCAGEICDLQQYIQQNVIFNQTGTYAIAFEQIMRTDELPGVMSVGLRVEEVKK